MESEQRHHKEPWVATILSMYIPGLGHFYGSSKIKGLLFFVATAILLLYGFWNVIDCNADTLFGYWLMCAGILVTIVCIVDSFLSTRKRNDPQFTKYRCQYKDPFLATFLSLIIPGSGYFYTKKWKLGLLVIVVWLFTSFYFENFYVSIFTSICAGITAYHAYTCVKGRVVYFNNIKSLILILALFGFLIDAGFHLIGEYYVRDITAVGNSNYPTVQDGDIVLRDIGTGKMRRGAIVAVQGIGMNNETVAKRLVAFEGETVEIKDGKVFVNGRALMEDPFSSITYESDSTGFYAMKGAPYRVPFNSIFVLGDNSKFSLDSRHFGAVDKRQLIGTSCKILWPLSRVRKL